MPAAYSISPEHDIVLCRFFGVVEDRELIAVTKAIPRDPAFRPSLAELIDLRPVERIRVSTATIHAAATVPDFGAGSRRALLVSSKLLYGLARMFQAFSDQADDEIRIFQRLDEALTWLGLDERAADLLALFPEPQPA